MRFYIRTSVAAFARTRILSPPVRTLASAATLMICVLHWLAVAAVSADEPICRIAAISNPYITTLSEKDLGDRSWIKKVAPAGLERSIALANAVKPDAMIVLGSLTWSGTDDEFTLVKESLSKFEAPLYLVPGVKDLVDGKDDQFQKYFAKENVAGRSLNVKGVHLQFSPMYENTGEAYKSTLDNLKTGLAKSDGTKAVLLFSQLDHRPITDPKSATAAQIGYWDAIHKHKVAVRIAGGHAHTVTYTDSLPYWSIPSSGWSYSPKWPIALITVYDKYIELDLVHDGGQPLQRLVIPNPVAAPRMVKAMDDPYGVPTYSEDLKRKPNLTFIQLSDSQFDDGSVPRYGARYANDEQMNELAAAQVNRLNPALVFMTGDLTNKNTKAEWTTFNRIYSTLKMPFYPVPGNHDTLYDRATMDRKTFGDLFDTGVANWKLADQLAGGKAEDRTALYRHFTKREPYYTVEKDDCAFICLNTRVASVDEEQMAWLRKELERTKDAKHVFLLGHYPVLQEFGGNVQGPEAQEILLLLRKYKVAAYLAGHRHRYGYRIHDGTAHVLCDCLCWGEYRSFQIYHVFDDHIVACWKPIFRADGNRPLYERVVLPEPRFSPQ